MGFCRGRGRIRIRFSNSLRFVLRCSYGGGGCIRQRAVGRVGAGTISVSIVRTDISLRGVLRGSYGLSLPLCIVDGSTGVCLNLAPWRTPVEAEGQQLHRVGTVVQCSAGSASAQRFRRLMKLGRDCYCIPWPHGV